MTQDAATGKLRSAARRSRMLMVVAVGAFLIFPAAVLAAPQRAGQAGGDAPDPGPGGAVSTVDPAGAAGKIKDILVEWGGSIALGVAALMAIAVIWTRKVNELVMLFVVLLGVGGLIFAQDQLVGIIKGFWGLVGGA